MISFLDSFLELLYPERNTCFICNTYDETIGDKYICSDCMKLLPVIKPPYCIKCCKPLSYDYPTDICRECIQWEKSFEQARAPFKYGGIIKDSVHQFKYYNKPYFYKLFGNLMTQYIYDNNYLDFDYIVSVPLHKSKLKTRGYNQAELIAKYIAKQTSKPYLNILKRTIKTDKQSSQSKFKRKTNLKNAFAVNTKHKTSRLVKDKNILLIDDIYTTGATADECAKTLLNFGAKRINVLTVAR